MDVLGTVIQLHTTGVGHCTQLKSQWLKATMYRIITELCTTHKSRKDLQPQLMGNPRHQAIHGRHPFQRSLWMSPETLSSQGQEESCTHRAARIISYHVVMTSLEITW
jgi:hypothetical protein